MDSTLKRRGNDRFHVVSTWNPRGVFLGKLPWLLFNYEGAAPIGGRHLREGDAYLKVRVVIQVKFQNFVIASLQLTIGTTIMIYSHIFQIIHLFSWFYCFYICCISIPI